MFTGPEILKRHKQTVHEGVRFQCTLCEKSFSQPNNLKLHIKKTHDEGQRLPCDFCEKTFALPNYLKFHLEKIHPEKISKD